MTDRELLERAAKAAGYDTQPLYYNEQSGVYVLDVVDGNDYWNPLTNDGDALRLAVKLRMEVRPWGSGAAAVVLIENRSICAEPHYGDDPERATRRAIVRAAAEMAQ